MRKGADCQAGIQFPGCWNSMSPETAAATQGCVRVSSPITRRTHNSCQKACRNQIVQNSGRSLRYLFLNIILLSQFFFALRYYSHIKGPQASFISITYPRFGIDELNPQSLSLSVSSTFTIEGSNHISSHFKDMFSTSKMPKTMTPHFCFYH